MTPTVTVLLAVHNGEPYLHEAVQSVLDQTFTDFELLVVDDASTDATVEIVESFGDERIRLLRNVEKLGQVPSLNRGLRESRGRYVARLDADDACRPARLARQVEILDAQPRVAVVGTWMDAVDERGRLLGRLQKTLEDYVDFLYHTLIMRVYVSHPSAMYRRDRSSLSGATTRRRGRRRTRTCGASSRSSGSKRGSCPSPSSATGFTTSSFPRRKPSTSDRSTGRARTAFSSSSRRARPRRRRDCCSPATRRRGVTIRTSRCKVSSSSLRGPYTPLARRRRGAAA